MKAILVASSQSVTSQPEWASDRRLTTDRRWTAWISCVWGRAEKPTSGPGGPLVERLPSAAEAVGGNDRAVPLYIVVLDVVEQVAATTDQHQQATPAVVVFLVGLEVLVEVVDALREKGDLHLGRPGIAFVEAVLLDDGRLLAINDF